MSKKIVALLLMMCATALCAAQAPDGQADAGGVTVVAADWRFPVNWRGESRADVLSGSSGRLETPARRVTEPGDDLSRRRRDGQLGPLDSEDRIYLRRGRNEAVVKLRNDGGKRIKSVGYDFQFVNAESGEVLLSYRLSSAASLRPGETKTLTEVVADRRAQQFMPANGARVERRAVVTRVEYADGSVWRRP
jgi:hypothetical protein